MTARFNQTYTQILVVCLLTYEMRERPWGAIIAIVLSATLAAIAAVISEWIEQRNAPRGEPC
jgi:hypothetical protein